MSGHAQIVIGRPLSLSDLQRAYEAPVEITFDPEAMKIVEASAAALARIAASGRTAYGVNTGFGLLAQTRIAPEQLAQLQRNLVLSHSAGVGALLPDAIVRLMMVLKLAGLARGASGVRVDVLHAIKAFLDREIYPCVPGQGSVGASGDLAPLAHMSAAVMGVGDVRVRGEIRAARDAIAKGRSAASSCLRRRRGLRCSTARRLRRRWRLRDYSQRRTCSQARLYPARFRPMR